MLKVGISHHNAHTMPKRFYKYMVIDVLKQFMITVVILVAVIAFGAAIKPMSSEQLLSGWDTLKYLFLVMVPMLQFAIPIAAAFATTLVLHRLSQDNEIKAMALSGQSYVKLLAPIAAFGLTLTLTLVVLTQLIIPHFVGLMARSMTADLPRLLASSIKQHTPFIQGDLVIWAEDIYLDTQEEDERMVLDHVAVAKRNKTGQSEMYLTAAAALVDVHRENDETSLFITTRDVAQWTKEENGAGILRGARKSSLTHGIELPSIASQRPSALSMFELFQLNKNPRKYPPVERASKLLQADFVKQAFLQKIRQEFQRNKKLVLKTATGGREFQIEAKGFAQVNFQTPITITTKNPTGEQNTLTPKKAKIIVDQSESGAIEFVTLQMKDVLVGAGEIGANQRGELVVPNLKIEGVSVEPPIHQSIQTLLETASHENSTTIQNHSNLLTQRLLEMRNQIIGRVNQRFAMSMLPLLVVLLGGLIAIRFSQQPPLFVFSKVFAPAIVALLLVFAGGQMVRDDRIISGFSVMWIGNISIVCFILFHWLRLRRT